jgi:hypothetical protein
LKFIIILLKKRESKKLKAISEEYFNNVSLISSSMLKFMITMEEKNCDFE